MIGQIRSAFQNAARTLRRSPGLTLMSVVALALGIGANTSIFSVLDAVLLRPLPFPEPHRLVSLAADFGGLNIPDVGMSIPEYEDLRDRAGVFEAISFVWPMDGNLTGAKRPVRTEALAVDVNYFELLGVRAELGRTFKPSDARPGVAEAIVLSHGIWERQFNADRNVIGRKLFLDYDTFVVIGVMPAGFRHPGATLQGDVEFWFTGGFGGDPWGPRDRRTARRLPRAIAKLKPGITIEGARSRLNTFLASLRRDFPGDYPAEAGWAPRIDALQMELAGRNNARLLVLVLGAVGLVLLICCATVANLLLAKAVSRQREFAIRASLGAGRGHLLLQLAVEGLLLAFAGALCGLAASALIIPALLDLAPLNLPRVNQPGVNMTLLAFTLIVASVAAVLSGFAPALQSAKVDLNANLKGGAAGSGVRASRHRMQALLVACQIAFSLVLMIGSGLLLRSFWNLIQVDPGFKPANVAVASIWLPPPTNPMADRKYLNPARRNVFVRDLLRQALTLPGVEAAAVGAGASIPLTGWNTGTFSLEDTNIARGQPLSAKLTSVSPDFFKVLHIPLIAGRGFTEDDDGGNRVCLIDRTMARRFFQQRTPIGRRILRGPAAHPESWNIVGVVGDVKTENFDAAGDPHIYFPIYQQSDLAMTVFLRTAAGPAQLAESLRRKVASVDPDLPIFGVRTMDQVVARSMAQRRFALQVIGAFAVLALTLSLLGIYGVTAFNVGERRREIGIRMALGARSGQVLAMVVRHGMRMAACGLTMGLAGAILLTRFLEGLLFDATATDPGTYLAVSLVLLAATLVSCWIPARKASRIDPSSALRAE